MSPYFPTVPWFLLALLAILAGTACVADITGEDLRPLCSVNSDCDDGDPCTIDTCSTVDGRCDNVSVAEPDQDSDGDGSSCREGDCNDLDPLVSPDASEICDGIDNNCDGLTDEGFDLDGDGVTTCGGDCNDHDPAIHPGAEETCDGTDNDCNGQADEGFDCIAGQEVTEPCGEPGACYYQKRTCSDQCTLGPPGACLPPECDPGEPDQVQSCGECTVETRSCQQTCTWGPWSACGVSPGWCKIEGLCHLDGQVNPDNTCQQCDATASPEAWRNKGEGMPCTDGNLCSQTDSCHNSTCMGANPVQCIAQDQCHDAGACNPQTGACSNPVKQDGSPCIDGDLCTQTDTCQGGTCEGTDPVQCTAQDQCHDIGVCEPQTGLCSNPNKQIGASCNDGNQCTQTDTCQGGVCTGSNPVQCPVTEPCVASKSCDAQTGACVPQYRPSSYVCQVDADIDIACPNGTGCGQDLMRRTRNRYCSGTSASCSGSYGSWSGWSLQQNCADYESCNATGDTCTDTRVASRWALCNPGEVYDTQTGLSWTRDYVCSSCTWSQAASTCAALGNGWRLPNINEVRSLVVGCFLSETGGSCLIQDPGCLSWWSCDSAQYICGGSCGFCLGPGENGSYVEPGVWTGIVCDYATRGMQWSSSVNPDDDSAYALWFSDGSLFPVDKTYNGPPPQASTLSRCVRNGP